MIRNILPNVPNYPASAFSWTGNVGWIEASEFTRGRVANRVWSDSSDVGFTLTSERTGQKVLFVFDHDEGEGDDLVYSVYVSFGFPKEIVVHVVND